MRDIRRTGIWLVWFGAERVHRVRPWWKWPKFIGIALLLGIRGRLRSQNLFDANDLPAARPVTADPTKAGVYRAIRSPDGSYNDLRRPSAGMADTRFGRNVPLLPYGTKYPVLYPQPRLVSDRLMQRAEFKPFPEGNALLAAWIQFMVRDWFNHGPGVEPKWRLPGPCTSRLTNPPELELSRTQPDPTGPLVGAPTTHVNVLTHWWDGSQIYPAVPRMRTRSRTRNDKSPLPPGEIRDDLFKLLRDPAEPRKKPELAPGFWAGLALMMSLFAKEHNAICRELHRHYPCMSTDEIFETARLVNAALMAKIHTVDWTAAVLSHDTTVFGTEIEWWGILGEHWFQRFGRRTRTELFRGIPGSRTKDFGVPFALTEEFVAVYRMHQMLPDHIPLHTANEAEARCTYGLEDLLGPSAIRVLKTQPEADLVYSFARAPAGLVTLHNVPDVLRRLPCVDPPNGTVELDLAATDILRCREQGVPRYNDLRRALHMKPFTRIDQITTNGTWQREISEVYRGDVDAVDLLVGLCAEELPDGFAFSDTAFRIFLLMAPRRLLSDRFFTHDYGPDVYTPVGMSWIEDNRMSDVIARHFPELEPSLDGVPNAFRQWRAPRSAAQRT